MVERIRTLLESRQLTPTQFADLIGVARPIISHILSGRNKPSLDVVQRILGAMPDLSMAWLLNGTEPMLTAAVGVPSVAPGPRPVAEPAVAPVVAPAAVAVPQPVSAVPLPVPVPTAAPLDMHKSAVVQQYKSKVKASASDMAVLEHPAAGSAAAEAAPANQPIVSAPRPPMPRRFSVKPAVVVPPAPGAATEAPIAFAPLPAIPVGSTAPAAGTLNVPESSLGNTVSAENSKKEEVGHSTVAPVESWATTGGIAAGAASVRTAEPAAAASTAAPTDAPVLPTAVPMPGPLPAPAVGPTSLPAPTLASDMASALFTGAEKPIRRIVIFYRDGSFADYQPE